MAIYMTVTHMDCLIGKTYRFAGDGPYLHLENKIGMKINSGANTAKR